ncbi:MAG: sigma-70 family RNA polymerase sigma factor [Pseudomonadota bacterium]
MDRDDDKKMMVRIAGGDKKAFEELYESTSKQVFYYLQRLMQSREGAEDVLIEVYAQVWQNAGNFRGQSRAKTWIFGIARNLALNELRKGGKRTVQCLPETLGCDRNSQAVDAFERGLHIQKALSALSLKHREIIDLVFFHDMIYSEIADLLDISENTVKTRIFYAKSALEEQLRKMENKRR